MKWNVLAICGMLLLMACEKAPETPAQAVGAFHGALAQRDLNRAVTYLAPELRQAFAKIGQRLAHIMEMEADDPLAFFLAGAKAEVANPILSIETLEQDGQRAKVRVTAGDCREDKPKACKVETLSLRRDEGRWVIEAELPPGLGGKEKAKEKVEKEEKT